MQATFQTNFAGHETNHFREQLVIQQRCLSVHDGFLGCDAAVVFSSETLVPTTCP